MVSSKLSHNYLLDVGSDVLRVIGPFYNKAVANAYKHFLDRSAHPEADMRYPITTITVTLDLPVTVSLIGGPDAIPITILSDQHPMAFYGLDTKDGQLTMTGPFAERFQAVCWCTTVKNDPSDTLVVALRDPTRFIRIMPDESLHNKAIEAALNHVDYACSEQNSILIF